MEEFQLNSAVGQEEGNSGTLSQIMEGLCSVISVTQSNMLNIRKDYDNIYLQIHTVSVITQIIRLSSLQKH
jgi:hypothetical protein